MTLIDKIAWLRLEDGKILSTRSRGKDLYDIPGSNASQARPMSTRPIFMIAKTF